MKKEIIIICAIVLFTAGSASAAITVYPNDRPGWESAVGVYEEEFFTDSTLNPGVSVVSDYPGYVNTTKGVWWDKLVCPYYGLTTTIWQFDTPIISYGGNWNPGVPGGPGAHIAVAVNGSWVNIGEIPSTYTDQFWGFVSTEPFSAVRLSPGSNCSPPGGAWCETYEINSMVYSISEPCIEKSFTDTTLFETLLAQQAVLNDVTVTRDFTSTLDFTNFELVSITTGPFAGKGFSKGECQTTLGGIPYTGNWQGALFLKPQERKIYLKGAVTGQISATVEGYLTESDSGSGIYDQYQATWKIGRLGFTVTSATIDLNGTVSYQSSSEFPATELYILQTNIEGDIPGHYSGPLSTVLTHLRVVEETNPYSGEGFCIMSYNSESGSGEGFTYDKVVAPGRVELKGLFTSPLFGIVSATLDESKTPRTLFLRIERIDLGLPPMADLKVKTWGPERVSPGQTINYIIEYRNDGLKAAEDIDIVMKLPYEVEFVSAMGGGTYTEASHEVIWYLGDIIPKSTEQLRTEVRVLWGLAWGSSFETIVSIPKERIEIITDPTVVTSCEILEISEDSLIAMGTISNQFYSDNFYMDVTSTIVPEMIEPTFEFIETAEGIELRIKVTVEGHSPANLIDILIKGGEKAKDLFDGFKGSREFKKTQMELQPFIDRLRDFNFISEEDHETICEWNSVWFFGRATIGVFEIFYPTKWGELLDKSRRQIDIATKVYIGRLIAEHIGWDLPADPEERDQEAYNLFQELHKGYLDATSHDTDSHKNEVAVARDPNEKLVDPEGFVTPGQILDYTIEYENEGEGIAFGVYFTDILDEDLDHSTLTIGPVIDVETGVQIAPPGTYDPNTRTITWLVGEVGPGQGGYSEFSVNIKGDAPEGTEVINYATVYFPSVPEITRTNGVVSIIPMVGAICGDVTHDNGNPVANVTVKVIDSENNQVGDPIVTGSDGTFYFDLLPVGTYSVMIVTPLGDSVSPGETQTGIEVTGYPCTEVYFVLTPTITSNDCRTIGYWKHQFDVYLSGQGHAQESSTDLEDYLDLVHLHFDVLGIYTDLENFDFVDAKNVLTVSGGQLMEDRAKQQLFALLLNFASGRIGNETVVSEDGRVAAEALTYAAILISDGDPENDELAKTICDLINNGQMIESGIIPESPKRYKVAGHDGIPKEYTLNQNYPNPFNPVCNIAYALPINCHVTLSIYNILGQKVRVLVDEHQSFGHKSARWDGKDDQGRDVASGVYFYRLDTNEFMQTKKMLLLR